MPTNTDAWILDDSPGSYRWGSIDLPELAADEKDGGLPLDPRAQNLTRLIYASADASVLQQYIPGYRIRRVLRQDRMGTVHLASEVNLQRDVALRVMRTDHVMPEALARFEHEIAILRRLDHAGIGRVLDVGSYHGPSGTQQYLATD